MHRLGPYLIGLAGLALAGSDTLHVGIGAEPGRTGLEPIFGLLLTAVGWIWSHRSLSKSLPGRMAAAIDLEAIIRKAATAAAERTQASPVNVGDLVAKAADAAAKDAAAQIIAHFVANARIPTSTPGAIEELVRSTVSCDAGDVSGPPVTPLVVQRLFPVR